MRLFSRVRMVVFECLGENGRDKRIRSFCEVEWCRGSEGMRKWDRRVLVVRCWGEAGFFS